MSSEPMTTDLRRFLVVEDDLHLRHAIRRGLRQAMGHASNYEMSWAVNLSEAEERVASGPLDLVLLDYILPNCRSAGEFVASSRRLLNGVPIIVMSGLPIPELLSVTAGFPRPLRLLAKPFSIESLSEMIADCLSSRNDSRREVA